MRRCIQARQVPGTLGPPHLPSRRLFQGWSCTTMVLCIGGICTVIGRWRRPGRSSGVLDGSKAAVQKRHAQLEQRHRPPHATAIQARDQNPGPVEWEASFSAGRGRTLCTRTCKRDDRGRVVSHLTNWGGTFNWHPVVAAELLILECSLFPRLTRSKNVRKVG